MKHRFSVFIFLCSALCAGQSTFTSPLDTDGQTGTAKPPVQGRISSPSLNREPEAGAEPPQFAVPTPPSTRVVGPLTTKSEFQQFAEDTAGRQLPVYGRQLFDQVPTTFAPADQIPVPSDYVIGPGDEILIRIWGKVDFDGHLTVDRNGQISLPKVGTLNVAGLRFEQLEGRIRSTVGNLYRDFEINVTLGRLRSIQIYVLGSARQPGTYTVSSLSTLVNVLFLSGGPSATGSMRQIELRRGNQTITKLDLYDLLRSGDKSHDAQLLPGDVIYIPPAGPQIAVFGSVNEPGIYELSGKASVDSALSVAGGLTSLAEIERVALERIEAHSTRRIEEFTLDEAGRNQIVKDGDLLRVFALSPQFDNSVTLRGNVAQPGRYACHQGMRISDLIPSREALITREYWNQQNHILQAEDRNQFGSPASSEFKEQLLNRSEVESEFRSSGLPASSYKRSSSDNLSSGQFSDQNQARIGFPVDSELTRTAPANSGNVPQRNLLPEAQRSSMVASIGSITAEINWDYAVIERLDKHDLSTRLIPFRLGAAIDDHTSDDNKVLKPGDIVTIFGRADLELPMEKHASFIRVGGEINAPGVYRVNPGETLQDVVRQAGGLTSHSYLYASKFTRLSTRRAEEEQLRQSSEQMQKELMSRYANAGNTAGQNAADEQARLTLQQAAIARLSAVRPTGRVVLQMKPNASTVEDIPALPLEDGDTLYVPPRLSTVQVTGSVYNANAFRYQDGKKLSAYLNDAGGPTREADKRRVFVIRADGTVISKQAKTGHFHEKFENLKLLPGDAVVVPERLKTPGAKGILEFTQGISQAAITAAALSTVMP